ncbi:hypothetical protein [Streptomyces sp. NPDC059063]|uniref:hypothetical protein n=1 Tax=Streptomyces sp. NPDC059063 TaxID=3346712 RepID=UPI0036AB16BD
MRENAVAQRELAVAQRERAVAQREQLLDQRERVISQRTRSTGRGYLDTEKQVRGLSTCLEQTRTALADQIQCYRDLEADYQDLNSSHNALVLQVLHESAARFTPAAEPRQLPECHSRASAPVSLIRAHPHQHHV